MSSRVEKAGLLKLKKPGFWIFYPMQGSPYRSVQQKKPGF
jgi:hypothetical protein